VPTELRVQHQGLWNIRKKIELHQEPILPRRKMIRLSYSKESCPKDKQIFFFDDDSETVTGGKVVHNDPFLKQMLVNVTSTDENRFVFYRDIRPEPKPETKVPDLVDLVETVAVTEVPPPASTRRLHIPARPEIDDIFTSLFTSYTDDVELLRAPCVNGIVKLNDQITHYGSNWRVTRLWCAISKKKAMVQLVHNTDDATLCVQALTIKLVDPEKSFKEVSIH
jgi:hypothetical protein